MFSWLKKSVGAKIALVTSLPLIFVAGLFLLLFHLLGAGWTSSFNLIQIVAVFVSLLVFVAILLVYLAIRVFIGRPLKRANDVMKIAEKGNFLVRLESQSADELGRIARLFNEIMARMIALDARKIEAEREVALIRQNLEYKTALEEKAKIIEQTNRQLESSLQDLSTLYDISQKLSHSLELNELLLEMKRILAHMLHLQKFCLLFYEEGGELLKALVEHGFEKNSLAAMRFRPDEGFLGSLFQEKHLLVVGDMRASSLPLPSLFPPDSEGSLLGAPLIVAGRVTGALLAAHPEKQAFSFSTQKLLDSVATQIALAYNRSQLYMRTKSLSVTDELTGLANRRHFQDVLHMEWKRAQRFGRPLSLLILDVDYFKHYNDRFGHLQGDQALKKMARILEKHVREVDTAARFGGEEFVIVLPDTPLNHAMKVGEKLRVLVEEQWHLFSEKEGQPLVLTISGGVSSYPERAVSAEDLINTADMALYQAKSLGRNRVIGFEKPLAVAAQDQEKHDSAFRDSSTRVIKGVFR